MLVSLVRLVRSAFGAFLGIIGLKSRLSPKNLELTLPKLEKLDLDKSIFSPSLSNDFINIRVDHDLQAWRKFSLRFLPESAIDGPENELAGRRETFKVPGGKPYTCFLPVIFSHEEDVQMPSDEEKKLMIESATKALNHSFRSKECLRFSEGWWTYEMCHMKRIRQYHAITAEERAEMIKAGRKNAPAVGTITSEYLLGRYLPNSPEATNIRFGNVFCMTYRDGDSCRTIDRGVVHRTTEVRFVCSDNRLTPHFIDVMEDSVCNYVMVIGAPAFCNIPSFKSMKKSPQTVFCIDPSIDTSAHGEKAKEKPTESSTLDNLEGTSGSNIKIKLERIIELVDSGDEFPLLKQAVLDLLQSEYGAAMPDSLASTLPRRSLFDVFSDLKAAQSSMSDDPNAVEDRSSSTKAGEESEDAKNKRTADRKRAFKVHFEL